MQDLTNRMKESWFDADGFFLARENGKIVGFCWTKIHHDRVNEGAIGEIYVIGVNPAAHSSGLGKALMLTALRYFQSKEIKESMLYVDADNHAALILYKKLGFNQLSTHLTKCCCVSINISTRSIRTHQGHVMKWRDQKAII